MPPRGYKWWSSPYATMWKAPEEQERELVEDPFYEPPEGYEYKAACAGHFPELSKKRKRGGR